MHSSPSVLPLNALHVQVLPENAPKYPGVASQSDNNWQHLAQGAPNSSLRTLERLARPPYPLP